MALPLAIAAGGSIIGGLLNAGGASAQRAWEERMADTQYQRSSADMVKAGLNPMMMYMKGGGLGSMPQLPPNPGAAMGEGIETAAKQAAIDIPMAQSTMAKQAADTATSVSQAKLNAAQEEKVGQDAILSASANQLNLVKMQQAYKEMELTDSQKAKLAKDIDELQARIALEQQQRDLTRNNARKSGVEADALGALGPIISSAAEGIRRLQPGYAPSGASYPNEDIRPASYIARQKAAAGQVTPQGTNSAQSSKAWWEKYVIRP